MDKVPCAFTFKYFFLNLKITDKFVNLIKDKSKLKAKIVSAVVGEKIQSLWDMTLTQCICHF